MTKDKRRSRHAVQCMRDIDEQYVIALSAEKNEPGWMTDIRCDALRCAKKLSVPAWAPDVRTIVAQHLSWYRQPSRGHCSWEQKARCTTRMPSAGVGLQQESEMVYKQLHDNWRHKGVVFTSTDRALKDHPAVVRKYFSHVVSASDNLFAALNTALWSGGSFVYVPEGVIIDAPLQVHFGIAAKQVGQFERTIIIAEKGASLHYVEGCSASITNAASLHAGVVEVVAKECSRIYYTTMQQWSKDLYNLTTKRAHAYKNARVSWVDSNIGSAVTMKYPSVVLQEEGASAELFSCALANNAQQQDTGGKMIHKASDTSSVMLSKSMSKDGGKATFRGSIVVAPGAHNVRARSQCDALVLDATSFADALPFLSIQESSAQVGHEASVNSLDDEQLFYLMSRGMSKQAARSLMVNGFLQVIIERIPPEFSIELQRLVELEMEDVSHGD